MKKGMLAGFIARFEDILSKLDEIEMDAASEDMEELNAQMEDAIFLLDSLSEDDEDADEDIAGALSELMSLSADYAGLDAENGQLGQLALELEMAARMAAKNIGVELE